MTESEPGASGAVAPWRPSSDERAIGDLRTRLGLWRRSTLPSDPSWSEGTDPDYLSSLIEHWVNDFDVSSELARSSRHPWFEASLPLPQAEGTAGAGSIAATVRFIHVRAERADDAPPPLPLLLCHGWPDSAWRYHDVIDLLTDPASHGGDAADAFDVVVPDMPGFGFSPAPAGPVLDSIDVARLFAGLMQTLGYSRYAVAGGDIGSSVARFIALDHADDVIAVHRMDAGIPVFAGDPETLSAEERDFLATAASWAATEGAYAAMHRTKPATIAAALADSPAGMAAWVVEKLHAWTDARLGPLGGIPVDDILQLLTVTWLQNCIGSSMRMYRANARISTDQHARRVEVPSGFSLFPADLLTPPRSWLDRIATVTSVRHPERGGHFAPREVPAIYAGELQDFFRPHR